MEGTLSGGPVWRFTLVQADDQEARRSFASLEDVLGFLREELAIKGRDRKPTGR